MPQHDIVEIVVGTTPERLVTVGTQLFVAVESTPQVKIIDTDTNTLSGAIDVGGNPWWMATVDTGDMLDISGTAPEAGVPDLKLYVRDGNESAITVLNLALLDEPMAHFVLDAFGGVPIGGGEMADSHRNAGVYLLDEFNTRMLVLNAATNTVTDQIELGFRQRRIAVSGDGSRVYVTHPEDSVISVIDPTVSPASVTRLHVPLNPFDVCVTPRGDRLYVTYFVAEDAGLLQVIDRATGSTSSVDVGARPSAVIGDDSRAYVSSAGGHRIDVVDTTTIPPRLIEQIPVNGAPSYLAFSADGTTLYAGNFTEHTVTAISLRP